MAQTNRRIVGRECSSFALTQIVNGSGLPDHLLKYLHCAEAPPREWLANRNSAPNVDFRAIQTIQPLWRTCTLVSVEARQQRDWRVDTHFIRLTSGTSPVPTRKEKAIQRHYA